MNIFRKVIGLLIIIFLGIPTLYSIIWAVGITKGVVSEKFLVDTPKEIVKDIPEIADEAFEIIQKPGIIEDENIQIWIEAAAKTGKKPSELLAEIGLTTWLEEKLPEKFNEMGNALKSEKTPSDTIIVDLAPLKNAMNHEILDQFLEDTISNLPECDASQITEFQDKGFDNKNISAFPACRPSSEEQKEKMAEEFNKNKPEINDEFRPLPDDFFDSSAFNFMRIYSTWMLLLFLIPAFFILIGAVIADSSLRGFLRWSSIPIMISSFGALITALIAKYSSLLAVGSNSLLDYLNLWTDFWPLELQEFIHTKVRDIIFVIISKLLNPVIYLSLIIFGIGLILLIISFFIGRKANFIGRKAKSKPEAPQSGIPPRGKKPKNKKETSSQNKKSPQK